MQRQMIWHSEDECHKVEETSGISYKEKFIDAVAFYITEVLGVSWKDKRVVRELLVFALQSGIEDLLDQFLHSQLEIIGRRFNRAFGIDATAETSHAVHAKMDQFIEAIARKFPE